MSDHFTSQSHPSTHKFVPAGGQRACINCNRAKSKCAYPDAALGVLVSLCDGFTETQSCFSTNHDGTPDILFCQRCRRLNLNCAYPTEPRKSRRVSSAFSVAHRNQVHSCSLKRSFSNISTSLDPDISRAKRIPSMLNMRSHLKPPMRSSVPYSLQISPTRDSSSLTASLLRCQVI